MSSYHNLLFADCRWHRGSYCICLRLEWINQKNSFCYCLLFIMLSFSHRFLFKSESLITKSIYTLGIDQNEPTGKKKQKVSLSMAKGLKEGRQLIATTHRRSLAWSHTKWSNRKLESLSLEKETFYDRFMTFASSFKSNFLDWIKRQFWIFYHIVRDLNHALCVPQVAHQ